MTQEKQGAPVTIHKMVYLDNPKAPLFAGMKHQLMYPTESESQFHFALGCS